MAKHPFADQARAQLEANGIVFNADGSTSKREDVNKTTPPEAVVATPANRTTIVVGETTQSSTSEFETPPQDPPKDPATGEDQNKLLELYRKRNEELEAKLAGGAASNEPTARERELEQELNALRSQISSQTEKQQADAVRDLLERKGFDSENVDDDLLLEIRDTFVRPLAEKMSSLEQRLDQTEQRTREPTAEEKRLAKKNETQAKIFEAIPDFGVIFKSSEFQKKLAEPDSRYPFKLSYGHALQDALENGNAEFIVNEVKAFISGKAPTIDNIADVGATNGVAKTAPIEQKDGFKYTPEEAIEMFRKRQRRELTAQQYSAYRAKLDAHRSSVHSKK